MFVPGTWLHTPITSYHKILFAWPGKKVIKATSLDSIRKIYLLYEIKKFFSFFNFMIRSLNSSSSCEVKGKHNIKIISPAIMKHLLYLIVIFLGKNHIKAHSCCAIWIYFIKTQLD